MTSLMISTILAVIERSPQWVRHDLGSRETAIRARAEETLAAMIAAAVQDERDAPSTMQQLTPPLPRPSR
ncbi:DUF6771 family protein [Sphingobium sp. YR657]|uniref:DUF6771 family protein n=1 Tax=Sphingobium sp. YR657 TaxID=1884366 RepID=UPI0009321D30|nr:DUF6771 family protein [Sphingobium sp. YR657]